MSEQIGAIPAPLIGWPSSVAGEKAPLNGAANRLNNAIEALNQAPRTAGLMGQVPYAGNAILGYVARNGVIDDWVGKVGAAFLKAEEDAPPGIGSGGFLQTLEAVLFDSGRLATSTDAFIDGQAGSNPTGAANDAAAGVEAGAQMKEGVATKNQGLVNGAINTLSQHQHDGAFDVPFFQTLGPQGTLDAVPFVNKAPRGLETFDTALGTATRSRGWDPGFNAALFKLGNDGQPDRNSLGLVQYGVDSADFLTQAGDKWLFQATIPGDRGFATVPILGALDRNPAAGSAWLAGSTPGLPGSRAENLLGNTENLAWQESVLNDPGVSAAFNKLLTDVGGVKNTAQLSTILHAIYPEKGSPSQFALTLWPGTAQIIAQNIGMFTQGGAPNARTPDWTWNQGLFDFAETSLSSKVHTQASTEILNAIKQWTLHAPVAPGSDGWARFEDSAGQLWATQALALKQADVDALQDFQADQAGWTTLANLLPLPPIPGGKFIADYAEGEVANFMEGWLAPDLANGTFTSQGQVDANSDTIYNASVHSLQHTLALRWLQEHPGEVPAKYRNDPQEYATLIVASLPGSPQQASPGLRQLTGDLGWASTGFSNVFDGKTSAGPGGS